MPQTADDATHRQAAWVRLGGKHGEPDCWRQTNRRALKGIALGMFAVSLFSMAEPAFAQASLEWMASMHQISGGTKGCAGGGRSKVVVKDGSLTVFRRSSDLTYLTIALRPDGSAEGTVATTLTANSQAMVRVAAGTGPRTIELVTYTNVCGYRYIPD